MLQRNSEDKALHPVHYASGKTTPTEEKYTSYELELLAIVKALEEFRIYLLGISFKIVTDCRAFALTMNKKIFVYELQDEYFIWKTPDILLNIDQARVWHTWTRLVAIHHRHAC